VPENLRREYSEYLRENKISSGYLFKPERGGVSYGARAMTTSAVEKRLNVLSDIYGIAKKIMHPHSFRHMYAKEFLKHGGDISRLADLLGHSSLETTRIYLAMSDGEIKKSVDETVTW
jgi:site-specific recombinase XerD